jgi:hypothetical protein
MKNFVTAKTARTPESLAGVTVRSVKNVRAAWTPWKNVKKSNTKSTVP